MKRFFKFLFLLPVALVVLALAVANRHKVTIFLDPFAGPMPEGTQIVAPLYIVMLLAVIGRNNCRQRHDLVGTEQVSSRGAPGKK